MNAAPATSGAVLQPEPAPTNPSPPGDYFDLIHPACPVICGRRLKPLSLTRYKSLKRLKVAFVADEPSQATARDLMIGVLVCSSTAAEFAEMLASERFEADLDRWATKFAFLPPKCFRWPVIGRWIERFISARVDEMSAAFLLSEMTRFQDYIQQNSRAPRYWDESSDSRVSGSHWAHNVEVTLRSALHWTADEIDEKPLNQALWDYFKHMENQGLVRIMTAEEIVQADTPPTPEKTAEIDGWLAQLQSAANGELQPAT